MSNVNQFIINSEISRISFQDIIYDIRARDGTYCTLPYPNHKKGCPNYPKCINERLDFKNDISYESYIWTIIIVPFNLLEYENYMKNKHPHWTKRQCRNLLYWQKTVVKKLKTLIECYVTHDLLLDIPEANGINMFATLHKKGYNIKANPDIVYKSMLTGTLRR